jgi:hypothetical protein
MSSNIRVKVFLIFTLVCSLYYYWLSVFPDSIDSILFQKRENVKLNNQFPIAPRPENPKEQSLLFMVASFSFTQLISLQKALDCMRDICNSNWDVTVLIQSSPQGLSANHPAYKLLKERMFCQRTNSYVPLILEQFENNKIGFGLNSKHRQFVLKHLEEYDIFSYAEEDMLLTVSHLQAYLHATQQLQVALPESWMRYQIGFLRYNCFSFARILVSV